MIDHVFDQPSLEHKARRYLEIKRKIEELGEEADLIRLEIKNDVIEGIHKDAAYPLKWQGVRITLIPPSTRFRLDKAKLVSAGVTAAQLAAGEIKTEIDATVRITGTAEEDE